MRAESMAMKLAAPFVKWQLEQSETCLKAYEGMHKQWLKAYA